MKENLSLMYSTNIPGLESFINAMILLAITIGLLVIFLTMYTTVIERTRDIGVLKSLGANHWFVIRALLSESAALCVLGVAAGIGLSYLVRAGFLWKFPTLTILITSEWILRAAGIALMGALLGASYPALLASRKDAVDALSYHYDSKNRARDAERSQRKRSREERAAKQAEWLVTNGNRSYNTRTCRRADFPGKKERGADTQNRKLVEALPRREGRSPGNARREFLGAAWRIGCRDGAFRLRQVLAAVRDRRPGASFPRQGARRWK